MDKARIGIIKVKFDEVIHRNDEVNIEFWYARELMPLLGYEQWRNFENAIEKAMISCQTAGIVVSDHFAEVSKMVQLGSGAKREIKDYMLTCYACYLIAQNGDPKKEEIAFAQSYFAVQTRKQENMKYSEFSLAGEVARYLNISCVLAAKILREAVDGMDVILDAVNRYNAVLDDCIIPVVFHALFEISSELKTEDKELVLLREPKDAGFYEFSAKDDLVITNRYPGLKPEEIKKSFHADTYCFDSIPEKECFMQYITSGKVKEVYFTGMFTSNQGDLSVHYYDPESGRIRQYYPDFLAKMEDGSYQLIEVKGDNKIDDEVVKAKAAAAEEMAVASGVKYLMYAGSQIVSTHILEDNPVPTQSNFTLGV